MNIHGKSVLTSRPMDYIKINHTYSKMADILVRILEIQLIIVTVNYK